MGQKPIIGVSHHPIAVLERRPGAPGAQRLICGPLARPRRWSEVGRVRRAGAWKCRVKKRAVRFLLNTVEHS